jgi:hypothetical protein
MASSEAMVLYHFEGDQVHDFWLNQPKIILICTGNRVTGPVTSSRRPLSQGRTGQTPRFSGDAADLKSLGANCLLLWNRGILATAALPTCPASSSIQQ